MGRLATYLRLRAFRQGVLGTSRPWLALWAAMAATRFLRKRLGREPKVLERIELHPGEAVVIRDTGITRKAFRA